MKNNQAKKHHYVPEFLIKRFSDKNDGAVYALDKQAYLPDPKQKTAAQVCYDLHLHTISHSQGRSLIIEDMFSKYESNWATTFEISIKNPNEKIIFKDENTRNILLFYISCQFWRFPGRKRLALQSINGLTSRYEKAVSTGNLLCNITRKDLKFFIKKSHDLDCLKILQFFLLPTLYFFTENDDKRNFSLIKKPDQYSNDFILSDNPVIYDSADEILDKNTNLLIPFSKDYLLSFADEDNSTSLDQISNMQRKIFDQSQRWVISSSRETLLHFSKQ